MILIIIVDMKRTVFIISLILSLASCSQKELNLLDGATKIELLQGKWDEYYEDPSFAMDGGLTWQIGKEEIVLHSYDVLTDTSEDVHIGYDVSRQNGQYIITLHYTKWAYDDSFQITVLNDKEMAWQKVGTTFSAGSYSGDYKHFVNDNFWKLDDNFWKQ